MNWYLKVLKQYADFNGRARRSEYWYFALFNVLISLGMGIISGLLNLPFLGTLYSLAVLIPGIAVAVRRMHDVGKSGWFILIPIYNIILAFTDGDSGDNKYGPNPKESSVEV
ncbi:MAG: DUF805 domain-containing protein [Crocinitomicaceae bacterium]|nr:DUF805 domain-containing protein [Crocinitomicaceae bacterium]